MAAKVIIRQIETRHGHTWENITFTMIAQIEQAIEKVVSETNAKLDSLRQQRDALDAAIGVYKELIGGEAPTEQITTLTAEEAHDRSQREILELIASKNGGVLVVKDAIRTMRELSIFANPDNADSAIYGVINRSKIFQRVAAGVYRVGVPEANGKQRTRKPGGLYQKLLALRNERPGITRHEAAKILVEQGYDFGDKTPSAAISGTWMNVVRQTQKRESENRANPVRGELGAHLFRRVV